MKRRKGESLLICILIPLAVGLVSALLTKDSMVLFYQVNKPPLSPPAWLFPVVWTLLYILMGIASHLVYQSRGHSPEAEKGLILYFLQLIVNFFWSFFFFRAKAYFAAFIWLVLLWILIYQTIRYFKKVNQTAANLMLLSLLWVTFAGYLNLGIFLLN